MGFRDQFESLERRTHLTAVTISTPTVKESASSVAFVMSIDSPLSKNLAIQYTTVAGTAKSGKDFTPTKGITWITPGHTTVAVSVPLIHDSIHEGNETFRLNIKVGGHRLFGVATIQDAQSAPTVATSYVAYSGASGGTLTNTADGRGYLKAPAKGKRAAFVNVVLSNPSSKTVTVNYQLGADSDTAVSNVDFAPASGTITFKPGQTAARVPVKILANPVDTLDRNLTVTLSNVTNGVLSQVSPGKTITIAGHLANGKPNPDAPPPVLVPVVFL